MRLKQTTLALLLLASGPAMAQNYEETGLYKEQRLQIEKLYDLLARVQQLSDSVAQERKELEGQKARWRSTCEKCLDSPTPQPEELKELLRLTVREVDGEELFKRLQNALQPVLAADGQDLPASDGKAQGKGKEKSKDKDDGNDSSESTSPVNTGEDDRISNDGTRHDSSNE